MKLITLNTWAGRIKQPFDEFLKTHAADTDIFCFQEIFNNLAESESDEAEQGKAGEEKYLLREITQVLSDFDAYFCPVIENAYGIAIFLKKGMELIANGEVVLYENPNYDSAASADASAASGDHARKMQWVHVKSGRKDFIIMNVHGHRDLSGKDDTPNRIAQSQKIANFIISTGMTPKILVGDFNLNPETESILMLEKHVVNLITKHAIASTRTHLYDGDSKHSDYVFISPEILVEQFKVLPDVVSDHAPLFIQFDMF